MQRMQSERESSKNKKLTQLKELFTYINHINSQGPNRMLIFPIAQLGVPSTRSGYKIEKTHQNFSEHLRTALGPNVRLHRLKAFRSHRSFTRSN